MGAFSAIIVFVKAFGPLLLTISKVLAGGLDHVVNYFSLKSQRLKNQLEDEIETRKKATDFQAVKEKANVKAFQSVEEHIWKVKYDQILQCLNEDEYDKILVMLGKFADSEVNELVFDHTTSNEYKALKLTNYMKSK